ncbi:MAG: SNF2-related protein [Spirochaetota bacterium]
MSCLSDQSWKPKYDSDDGPLDKQFYERALRCAVRYDRTTGYFTAAALTVASRGIEHLVDSNGRMRLLVGCTLDEQEIDAVKKGQDLAEALARKTAPHLADVDSPSQLNALQLLSWMIASGYLEIRVAVPCSEDRTPIHDNTIFHEKTGIIEDIEGSVLAFEGSVNETLHGWTRNFESFSAHYSWKPGHDEYIDSTEEAFARKWQGRSKRLITVDVPTAVRDDLLKYLPVDDELPRRLKDAGHTRPAQKTTEEDSVDKEPIDRRRIVWEYIHGAPSLPENGYRVAEETAAVELWPHQIRAFDRMRRRTPTRLLIADEVGLGKTIQAGILIRHLWLTNPQARILILAPKAVVSQWQIELREKFNLLVPIYDGRQYSWYPSLALARPQFENVSKGEWSDHPIVITSSHLMRRRDRLGEIRDADSWDLIIVDEAHHARRRGMVGSSDRRPNQMLQLLEMLSDKTDALVFLTATPMQVSPTEVYDLLRVLGLPSEWSESAFLKYYEVLGASSPSNDELSFAAKMFRNLESVFEPIEETHLDRILESASRPKRRKVLRALRNPSVPTIPTLSTDERKLLVQVLKAHSPVSVLVSRHTRRLLRMYYEQGKISTPIAKRNVHDEFIQMSDEERSVYDQLEEYITTTFNAAEPEKRTAVGFVLTVYRKRVASSFYALRETLAKRIKKLDATEKQLQVFFEDEDIPEDGFALPDTGETITTDDQDAQADLVAAVHEEQADIHTLLATASAIERDTKVVHLLRHLEKLRDSGYRQTMVFTQYTDSLDMLRDIVADETGRKVICFSGRGGEIRDDHGYWQTVGREKAKQVFRDEAEIMLCTDAAAEGLNFQFCGSLINYDMPWNPMKVEQRIGRIDRLGQKHEEIRVINLHYAGTVEADVYRALSERILDFENFVGKLQPILSKIGQTINDLTLVEAGQRGRSTKDRIRELVAEADELESAGFDIDELASQQFDPSSLPIPPYTRLDLEKILRDPDLLDPGVEVRPLHGGRDYSFQAPGMARALRVTTDTSYFDQHAESVELWTPGSPLFPRERLVSSSLGDFDDPETSFKRAMERG